MTQQSPAPSGPPLPKWVGWVAWGAGAIALYAMLLGEVTMDAFDAEYPTRDEVRADANSGKPLVIDVGDEAKDSAEVRDALSLVPEMLTILAEQRKARIIITNLEAIRDRGLQPDSPASHTAGYFTEDGWSLYIAYDAQSPGMVALHEYGHFVDAALGRCSGAADYMLIYKDAKERGELGRHYLSSEAELFAYMFEQHYFSDRRRKRLAEDYPKGAEFISSLASSGSCPGSVAKAK